MPLEGNHRINEPNRMLITTEQVVQLFGITLDDADSLISTSLQSLPLASIGQPTKRIGRPALYLPQQVIWGVVDIYLANSCKFLDKTSMT
mgnify:CR=1 FL=1